MNCPYCLAPGASFQVQPPSGGYHCSNCRTPIPRGYVESPAVPRAAVGVIGYSGHGKTVFLTALFSQLARLSNLWDGYYYRSLDDFTHRVLYQQVPAFDQGHMPESTPANFPNPALIHYRGLPSYGNAFLAYYDTAGEVFQDVTQILRGGYFVAHADTALFILSLPDLDLERIDEEMSRLLDTYIRAVYDRLNVQLRQRQDLIVILSKADLLLPQLPRELGDYLQRGTTASYAATALSDATIDAALRSHQIADWLRTLGASRFLNMATDYFRSAQFSLISATGLSASGIYEPLRVLDPFLLVLQRLQRAETERKAASWWHRLRALPAALQHRLQERRKT